MSTSGGKAPAKIQAGKASYSRRDDLAAVPLAGDGAVPHDARLVLEGDGIAVVPAAAARSEQDLRPVYELEPGGTLAVPTGRVFIRFAEGQPAAGRRDDFAQAGYTIESIAQWAPHSAWLRPVAGGVAAALAGLDRLRSLPGVEHVEPELLRPRREK